MSESPHKREFSDDAAAKRRTEALAEAKETAGAYARAFCSEDGARVLADLRRKFGHHRPRFTFENARPITAAIIDGQCDVLREIERAIEFGSP